LRRTLDTLVPPRSAPSADHPCPMHSTRQVGPRRLVNDALPAQVRRPPEEPGQQCGRAVGHLGLGLVHSLRVVERQQAHVDVGIVHRRQQGLGIHEALVRVQQQDPLARAALQRRVAGGREVVAPREDRDPGAVRARDGDGRISRARIDDDQLGAERASRREGARDQRLFVTRHHAWRKTRRTGLVESWGPNGRI